MTDYMYTTQQHERAFSRLRLQKLEHIDEQCKICINMQCLTKIMLEKEMSLDCVEINFIVPRLNRVYGIFFLF